LAKGSRQKPETQSQGKRRTIGPTHSGWKRAGWGKEVGLIRKMIRLQKNLLKELPRKPLLAPGLTVLAKLA
jgi:hypothetical protein